MKFTANGEVEKLGWTADDTAVALQLAGQGADKLVIEFPVAHLPELSLIAIQLATMSSQKANRPFDPPILPVQQWSAGVSQSGDMVLKLEYPTAGAHSFRLDRAMAAELQKGLARLLSEQKPN